MERGEGDEVAFEVGSARLMISASGIPTQGMTIDHASTHLKR